MNRFRFHDSDEDNQRDSLPFPRGGVYGISIPLDEPGTLEDFADDLFKKMDEFQEVLDEVNRDLDEADRALDIIAHLPPDGPYFPAA